MVEVLEGYLDFQDCDGEVLACEMVAGKIKYCDTLEKFTEMNRNQWILDFRKKKRLLDGVAM